MENDKEQNGHCDDRGFSALLSHWISETNTFPPVHAFDSHPAHGPLADAIFYRKCMHREYTYCDTSLLTCRILSQVRTTANGISVMGYENADVLRGDVQRRVICLRSCEMERHIRGNLWIYESRQKLLYADLIDDTPPVHEETREAWELIRDTYAPIIHQEFQHVAWV